MKRLACLGRKVDNDCVSGRGTRLTYEMNNLIEVKVGRLVFALACANNDDSEPVIRQRAAGRNTDRSVGDE